jgi:hypothetical protein
MEFGIGHSWYRCPEPVPTLSFRPVDAFDLHAIIDPFCRASGQFLPLDRFPGRLAEIGLGEGPR